LTTQMLLILTNNIISKISNFNHKNNKAIWKQSQLQSNRKALLNRWGHIPVVDTIISELLSKL
jgi:hypothetical protein